MTLHEIIVEIAKLTPQERKALRLILDETLLEPLPEKEHSVLEFEGIGEKLRDMDAQEYVNQLRSEWDHRP